MCLHTTYKQLSKFNTKHKQKTQFVVYIQYTARTFMGHNIKTLLEKTERNFKIQKLHKLEQI